MAYYHKYLKYHEDTALKRNLTEDDRSFLRKLQTEMNTQDTCETRDPRFWVIKGSEKVYDNDNPDMYGLSHHGTIVAEDTDSICAYLNEEILPECDEIDWTECRIEKESGFFDFVLKYKNSSGELDEDLMTSDDLNTFLQEHGYDDFEVIGISVRPIIYPNTMFLTEKDARQHLEANHYHYSDDAHTYCMSAWRSLVVERLWKILQETAW